MFMGAVLEAVNECEAGNSPPDTGGVDATSRRSREASFNGADGWSGMEPLLRNAFRDTSAIPTTPSSAAAVASHLFLMAQPPLLFSGGEYCAQFIHILIDRATGLWSGTVGALYQVADPIDNFFAGTPATIKLGPMS